MRSLNESHDGNEDEDVDEVCICEFLYVFELCNIGRGFWMKAILLWMRVTLIVRWVCCVLFVLHCLVVGWEW